MIDIAESATRVRYFKRYKMEVGLAGLPRVELPPDYRCLPWHPALI